LEFRRVLFRSLTRPPCGWAAPLRVNPSACAATERNYSTANFACASQPATNLAPHAHKIHPPQRKPLISIEYSIERENKYSFSRPRKPSLHRRIRMNTSFAPCENPMGTNGFEFVEYAAPDPAALGKIFEAMGFKAIARHRHKD